MRAFASLPFFLFALFAFSGMQCAKNKLSTFNWLLGTWKMETGETYFVEEWRKVNDSTFEASSYKYSAQDTATKIPLESVQLVWKKGNAFYVPTVTGQNKGQPVYFKFMGIEKQEFLFENKEHNFPQRIYYKPVSANQLYARVEGIYNERFTALEFEYNRVK